MLILSFTLPLAFLFSFHLSAKGVFDAWQFWTLFTGSTAVMWGGLALYTRETDRVRHLTSSPVTFVRCDSSLTGMRQHEKAALIWQILQDDTLYRKQTRMWWRAVRFMLESAIVRAPAILLAAISLVFWLSPDQVVALVADIQTGAATCQVYAAGNILLIAYVLTGAAFGLCEMPRRQEGDFFCFAPEYQERVREFARAQQKAGEAENASSVSRQEVDE